MKPLSHCALVGAIMTAACASTSTALVETQGSKAGAAKKKPAAAKATPPTT